MTATGTPVSKNVPILTLTAEIGRVLENLSSPERLAASSWMAACLVNDALRKNPGWIKTQALRAVFTEGLDILDRESVPRADILRGRFWEGLTVRQMVEIKRPRDWQERNLLRQQASAIRRFGEIMTDREVLCRRGATTEVAHHSNHRRRLRVGVALVSLAVVVVVAIALTFSSTPSPAPLPGLGGAIAHTLTTTPTPRPACGEFARATAQSGPQFLRHQGVSSFTVEGSGGLVHNNKVRSLALDRRGLWVGFFSTTGNSGNGLAHYDKLTQSWANCDVPEGTQGKDVNDIAIDPKGRVWVAAEKTGVAMFDGSRWRTFTEKDGLPSADTFGLAVDPKGDVWVSTWNGVATFDGQEWSTPFTTQNGTLAGDHAHAIAFDSTGDIWVGLIRDGINRLRHTDGSWVHLTKEEGGLSGNEVRAILVRPERESTPESVWIATNDGGISVYEKGVWSRHTADTGLPSNSVNDLAIDRYNRVWAATSAGVSYLVDATWTTYTALPSLSIAIGVDCTDCPYDSDHVLVGTLHNGITHSRLPLDTAAVEVLKEVYPTVVAPGEHFVPEITIAPKAPYKLDGNRGDFLSNTDEDDTLLFGTHEHIAVKGIIEPGAAFTFREPNLPFIAPRLPDGVVEKTYTSTWRMWMHTRYVGPSIHITFTVRR